MQLIASALYRNTYDERTPYEVTWFLIASGGAGFLLPPVRRLSGSCAFHTVGGRNIAGQKQYDFIWFSITMLKNHIDLYGFRSSCSKTIGIHMIFDHHLQKPYKFIWFLSMMIESPMNSYGF